MGPVLFPLAIAMMAGGAASTYFGAPIIDTERGWTMVIAGSVVGSGGAVLMGLATAGERLKRVERAIMAATAGARAAAEVPPAGPPYAEVAGTAGPRSTRDGRASFEASLRSASQDEQRESAVQPKAGAVVGSYASGPNSYEMFADGSIRASTPTGEHRFGSMEELRSFFASRHEPIPVPPGALEPQPPA